MHKYIRYLFIILVSRTFCSPLFAVNVEKINKNTAKIEKIMNSDTSTEEKGKLGFKYFSKISEAGLGYLWQTETNEAIKNSHEPEYLKYISCMMKYKINLFIEDKEKFIYQKKLSNENWIKHANSLFFTMRAALSISFEAAFIAAIDAAGEHAESAALLSPFNIARKTIWFETKTPLLMKAWKSAYAFSTDKNIIQSINPIEKGKKAYRISEKVVLLYLLKNSDEILSAFYTPMLVSSIAKSKDIFGSRKAWKKHKNKIFKSVLNKPEQAHFIHVWIENLDRITKIIDP